MFNNKLIKVISFDATNTIFRVRISVGANYDSVLRRYGVYVDKELVNKHFIKSFSLHSKQSPCYGNSNDNINNNTNVKKYASGLDWWSDLIKILIEKSSNLNRNQIDQIPKQAFHDLYHQYGVKGANQIEGKGRHEFWELYPEVHDTLQYLKDKGYILSMISNFDDRLQDLLKNLNVLHYFNHSNSNNSKNNLITTSIDVGAQKPNPKIFDYHLKQLQSIDPSIVSNQVVYIGDSIDKDAKASLEFGFQSCLLDRENKLNQSDIPNNCKLIHSLNDLKSYY
ncbi:hypothetical protein CYY_010535 [Polysphondylium violaceum]|uniref:Haloacid dehalogenase-like hydrolase domain-containing protein 3 n=1 Tax=Polysphondylium violaceum TaxID=133409 RepID=A0A8J4PJH7_9MYCE|nr:hypothetical protein CYY_010535 [Polysphondylium violaceum]